MRAGARAGLSHLAGVRPTGVRWQHVLRRESKSLHQRAGGHPAFTRFAFPTWWHYDVLRGLEHLRRAAVAPDERVAEAVDLLRARLQNDGRGPLDIRIPRIMPTERDDGVGRPSRWISLRAQRVLGLHSTGR